MQNRKIVLASSSPRRLELLSKLNLKIEVIPSGVVEDFKPSDEPAETAMRLSYIKAMDIASKLDYDSIVIGADTIVYLDQILGKPDNEKDALKILMMLSGKSHYVMTGITIIDVLTKKCITDFEKTLVKMTDFDEKIARNYIKTKEPMDKAGAYGIQGLGALLVEKLDGCYFNVVGLPLMKLSKIMRDFDIEII